MSYCSVKTKYTPALVIWQSSSIGFWKNIMLANYKYV